MKIKTSDFGKGFIYSIVLFAKHFERFEEYMERNNKNSDINPDLWTEGQEDLWFYGASDHFFELEIPKQFKKTEIGKLAKELRDEALERRLGITTVEEFKNFFERLEKLCIMIDEKLGVEVIKAEWN